MNNWDDKTNEELATLYQETKDNSLYEYFLQRNYGLLIEFINKYNKHLVNRQDELEQIGTIAMWEALKDFDITKGAKFSTYYTWHIKKQMSLYKRTMNIVRLPAHVMDNMQYYIDNPKGRILSVLSLSEPAGYDDDPDTTLEDLVESDELNPEDKLITDEERKALEPLLNHLAPREEFVVRLWLGLDRDRPRTLQECGDQVGVTRERIRQIVAKAIKRLRRYVHLYFDVEPYNPSQDKFHDKPKTHLRNYTEKTKNPKNKKTMGNERVLLDEYLDKYTGEEAGKIIRYIEHATPKTKYIFKVLVGEIKPYIAVQEYHKSLRTILRWCKELEDKLKEIIKVKEDK